VHGRWAAIATDGRHRQSVGSPTLSRIGRRTLYSSCLLNAAPSVSSCQSGGTRTQSACSLHAVWASRGLMGRTRFRFVREQRADVRIRRKTV
jgi:hypothetical protein